MSNELKINESLSDVDEIIESFQNNINSRKRVKRYDFKMRNGCSSHETGLGMAYLSLVIQNYAENL